MVGLGHTEAKSWELNLDLLSRWQITTVCITRKLELGLRCVYETQVVQLGCLEWRLQPLPLSTLIISSWVIMLLFSQIQSLPLIMYHSFIRFMSYFCKQKV